MLTVADLIAALKALSPDRPVLISGNNGLRNIYEVLDRGNCVTVG